MNIKRILCLVFVLLLGLALWSCDGENPPAECTEHTDENGDLKCDVCEAPIPCTDHTDADKDLKCDTCSADIECAHVDENNDGICDIEACKWDYDHTHTFPDEWQHDALTHWKKASCSHSITTEKTSHSDENNDGICDGCSWNYDHTHTFLEAWEHDAESHWHNSACLHSVTTEKAAHSDENNDGVCDGCSWNYDHTHTYHEEWERDSEGHWHNASCSHSVTTDKAAHDDRNQNGICHFCGYVICAHTYDTESWGKDEDGHWHPTTCGHNTVKGEVFPHTLDDDGFCTVCDYDTHHVHTYENEWSYNTGYHWYNSTCHHPSKQKDHGEHVDENKDGKCEVCLYQFCTHTFEKEYTVENGKHWYKATCGCNVTSGEGEHYDDDKDSLGVCDACGYQMCQHTYDTVWTYYDKTYHCHKVTCGHSVEPIDKAMHADEDKDGKCDGCEYQLCTHTFEEAYTTDGQKHWHKATCGCNVTSGEGEHYDNDKDSLGVCDVCGYQMCQHTYERLWTYLDDTYHYKNATCGHDVTLKEEHRNMDYDMVCDGCESYYEGVDDIERDDPEEDPEDMILTPPHVITPPTTTP